MQQALNNPSTSPAGPSQRICVEKKPSVRMLSEVALSMLAP